MADLTVQFDLREGGVDSADKKSFSVHTEDGSKVNIRDFPGLGGNVVTQVEPGTALTSVQMTEREQTIDGLTAHWYEVYDAETEDYLGWIFGGFIQ